MNITSIFPYPIGISNINRSFTKNESEVFELMISDLQGNIGNNISTNKKVLDHSGLSEIKNFIDDSVQTYFKEVYQPKYDVVPYVTVSWINVSRKDQWHHMHNHSNSFMSGVFYINAIKNLDQIFFYRDEYEQLLIKPKEFNLWNSSSWFFQINTGDLIIFPSKLKHSVKPVVHDLDRISLSFNVFIKGSLGECETPTELKL